MKSTERKSSWPMRSDSETRLSLAGKKWVLEGDPYVLARAVKALPMAQKLKNGNISLPITPEIASELMWFRSRFPFKTACEARLRGDSAKDKLRKSRLDMVEHGTAPPAVAALRPGEKARTYQTKAAQMFHGGGSLLLGDDVGLGKTLSAILSVNDPKRLPAIVACPAGLTHQWLQSIERFTFLKGHILKKTAPYSLQVGVVCGECGENPSGVRIVRHKCEYCGASKFESQSPDVVITSYHKLHGWVDVLGGWAKTIVFDEIQELRQRLSRKYESAKAIAHGVDYRLGLSATPVYNMGGEMFNVLDVLFPGRMGTQANFRGTWCGGTTRSDGREPAITEPAAFGRYLVRERLMLRRTRDEVGRELPSS